MVSLVRLHWIPVVHLIFHRTNCWSTGTQGFPNQTKMITCNPKRNVLSEKILQAITPNDNNEGAAYESAVFT